MICRQRISALSGELNWFRSYYEAVLLDYMDDHDFNHVRRMLKEQNELDDILSRLRDLFSKLNYEPKNPIGKVQ
jgi:hypothetical protein